MERIAFTLRLTDTNILEIQMAFTDPVAFEKPWVVTRYFRRGAGGSAPAANQPVPKAYLNLNDRPCIPNVRMDENGFQVALLPQELEAQKAKSKKRTKRKESPR